MSKTIQTDLYQITMLAGYFHTGQANRRAACEMFVRRLPANRNFLLVAGLEKVLDYLNDLHFEAEDIEFLRKIPALKSCMTPEFEKYLRDFRFTGDVWAMPEGSIAFQNEPLIRIEAPIGEAQLVETFLLSAINHATMVASKAARVVLAAHGRGVLEFGTRRTHEDAALDAARASYLAGCIGTSNVEAGRVYGIPVVGTAAHMWTMAHESEPEAFANYCKIFPDFATLLVDTYDSIQGVKNAIEAAGPNLKGVRLDSGDIASLSKQIRKILDAAGCQNTKIVASGDLNETEIDKLIVAQAPVDIFGVGTDMVVSRDAPSIGGVYKLVEIERNGKMVGCAKFSEGKATYPGRKQVFRHGARDDLGLMGDTNDGTPLLLHYMERGQIKRIDTLAGARKRAQENLSGLPYAQRTMTTGGSYKYPVTITDSLQAEFDAARTRNLDNP